MDKTELDELRVLVVVDNETDTLSSVDEGVPQLPELVRHLGRAPVARTTPDGHECREGFEHLCIACHGFSAIATARQKNVWARAAWADEMGGGRKKRTVRPPRTPWAITVAMAPHPSIRIQRRFSARHVQTARTIVSRPATCAIMRCVCSNFTPPTSFGIL